MFMWISWNRMERPVAASCFRVGSAISTTNPPPPCPVRVPPASTAPLLTSLITGTHAAVSTRLPKLMLLVAVLPPKVSFRMSPSILNVDG